MFINRARITAAILAALTILVALEPATAHAYGGPSAGVSFLGAALGGVVAMFSALGIIVFWPIRLLARKLRGFRTGTSAIGLTVSGPEVSIRR